MSRTLRTDFWDGKVTTVATGRAVAGVVDAWQVLGDGSALYFWSLLDSAAFQNVLSDIMLIKKKILEFQSALLGEIAQA
jgi:hypothetical protein